MSYTRGDPYIWSDGDFLHLWSVTGRDGWEAADGYGENRKASGVLPFMRHMARGVLNR